MERVYSSCNAEEKTFADAAELMRQLTFSLWVFVGCLCR